MRERIKRRSMLNMKRFLSYILPFLLFPLLLSAQGADDATPPPAAVRSISQKQWEDASKGLDYSKDVPKPPKAARQPRQPSGSGIDWTGWTQGWGIILQTLAVILAVAGIGYGIYRMLQEPRDRTIARDGIEITAANLDAYIHETDLDRFLRDALAEGNYTLAIRLYYLQIIKTLSERQVIQWARDNTNRDYLNQTRQHRLHPAFRAVTRTYEQVWYGNQTLDATTFAALEPDFKNFLAAV